MAFSSRFCASAVVDLGGLLGDQRPRLVGREVPAEELRHQAKTHRELVGLPVVHGEDAVLVAGEVGELPHVVPHPLVGGVEQVRAVLVHLDAGLRLGLGVGVAADVRASLDDEDTLVQLRRHALGDRQAEESGADDEEVESDAGSAIGSKGITTRRAGRRGGCGPARIRAPVTASSGRDWLTIPYRHSRPTSHISTIDHVGTDRLNDEVEPPTSVITEYLKSTSRPYIEETSVPNRRRRRLSTAMSAVAALAVASPVAVVAISELSAEHQARAAAPRVRPGRDDHRPAQRADIGAVAGPVAVRHQPAPMPSLSDRSRLDDASGGRPLRV